MSRRGIPETVKLVHEQEDLITDLRRRLDAAEARALTAEHEVEVVREERVKYGNGYYVENARAEMATARAERIRRDYEEACDVLDRVRTDLQLVGANFDEADAERERMRPVVEAAKEIVFDWWKQVAAGETFDDDVLPLEAALVAAVDTYETQEGTDYA